MEKLKFSKGNAKLGTHIQTISLLSGWSCPFAHDCLSKAVLDEVTNKRTIVDGKHTQFRCFSASQEALYTDTYNQRKYNFDLVKKKETNEIVDLIEVSIPKNTKYIRIHVGGDFFNQKYFDAWLEVAKNKPNILFYAYTKALPFWIARLNEIPENFKLNASRGGKHDDLIKEYNLKEAVVVFSEEEAEKLGLEIDHDDTHAYKQEKSFALLIHGAQPKGSDAMKAITTLKQKGWTGYKKKEGRKKENLISSVKVGDKKKLTKGETV